MTDADAQPLKFQLFSLNENGIVNAVTDAISEPEFSFVGIPSDNDNSTRVYIIQVRIQIAL